MTTALIVDDDPGILKLMATVLFLEGITVQAIGSGVEGLEAMGQTTMPDVIVLDLSMPDLDGREFYRQARLRGYAGPIVICSAYGARAAEAELGAQGAIEKPFNPDELARIVKELTGAA